EMLKAAGLRLFWTEPNLVHRNYNRDGSTDPAEARCAALPCPLFYSFLDTKGNNVFIKDAPER
ncbi:hypothetical protein B0H10DRAFT_1794798, partial [Mycena sp. CBHHK59/15]